MAKVKYTTHLQKFFPTLKQGLAIEGRTIAEVVAALDSRYPGLGGYIVDERGALRKHVNIFIGDSMIADRERLQDVVSDDQQIFIMQALSGG